MRKGFSLKCMKISFNNSLILFAIYSIHASQHRKRISKFIFTIPPTGFAYIQLLCIFTLQIKKKSLLLDIEVKNCHFYKVKVSDFFLLPTFIVSNITKQRT